MPDLDPSAAAVARGVCAMLARRDAELGAGATQIGWKIGFNSPAIRRHFGLEEAVVGYLVDRGVTPNGATMPLTGWVAPAIEVEVAIRVGEDGGVAGLAPALELVDLGERFDDVEAALGGNIWQRGVVFGPEVPGADPWAMVARVTKTAGGDPDTVVAEGQIVEDPAETVAFVRSFLSRHGATLEPGQRIIAGSVVAPLAVAPGDALGVDYGPLGELRIAFV
jgi:2-keto-4-pentenoate hydratase